MSRLSPMLLAALLVSAPAFASDKDIFDAFGILGTSAIDCEKHASKENPHTIFEADDAGRVTRKALAGSAIDATLKVRNAHLLRDDLLEYDETGRSSELRTQIMKIDGKFRGWYSIRTSGPQSGTVLVDQGTVASTGRPTVAFAFCHR